MDNSASPTLQQIPQILREQFDKLSTHGSLPDIRLLHVIARDRNSFKKAIRAATFKHFLKASQDAPLLVCVSSSHLTSAVDEALQVRPNGLLDWTYPELKSLPRSTWHGSPPIRMIGSDHLTDVRFELKDFAETVCGMILPDPAWRAFFASALGRTIVSLEGDPVGDWIVRDGYVTTLFGEPLRT